MSTDYPIHLAVALDGAGWHPAAWRHETLQPAELFSPQFWTELVQEAERGLLDLVTLEDRFAASRQQDGDTVDIVHGTLDPALIAARIGPVTHRIGLVPTAIAPHTEPFHISKSIATLDHVTSGRAGLRVRTSADPREFANIGRRPTPRFHGAEAGSADAEEAFGEVSDYIEVVRRLWDSWEDDAEIRDVDTGRFIDRDRLHYIDFQSPNFSVRGPSITPRPPQGQPVITVRAHDERGYALIGRDADIGLTTPRDAADAARIATAIRKEAVAADRDPGDIRVLADLVVFLDRTSTAAHARKDDLDELAGGEFASDAAVFVGTPDGLTDQLLEWSAAGVDGFRLRPASARYDLERITRDLVPRLQQRGAFRPHYTTTTLREHFGLPRPASRYSAA
ncbi:LLM class flavin-dependent oxidoreductase [Flexivirga endophytica]|nr:LLM class flavin-dependent oxidoreductase [Flexivirga endophytica]